MTSGEKIIGLGIDGGGSATRWVMHSAGAILAAGELAGVSGHLHVASERDRFANMVTALREQIAAHGAVYAVIAGITGLAGTSAEAPLAAALLAEAACVAPSRVRIENDLWIAYHAVFAPGEGHVVYAGTGSAGSHIRADGTEIRVGGRGLLIDDAGSAFWIGREAVNRVFRARDENPRARGILADALFDLIGADEWDMVRGYLYVGGRDAVAQLARAVAAAAAAGDADALFLLRAAGRELARLATALAHREGVRPVALLGRAAGLHPCILDAMREAVHPLVVTRMNTDNAATAARLASEHAVDEHTLSGGPRE